MYYILFAVSIILVIKFIRYAKRFEEDMNELQQITNMKGKTCIYDYEGSNFIFEPVTEIQEVKV